VAPVQEPVPRADADADGQALIGAAETGAAFFILALMSSALLGPVFAPDQNPDAVPWLRTIWLPVYGLIGLMLAANPLRATRVALPAMMSLILVAWAFASSRWSIAPDVTLRRSIALLFTTLFGLHLAARYDWRELIELLAAVYIALAIGSYVAALAFPSFGVHATIHPGAWKGLWYEKNQMGGVMVIGTLAGACAALLSPRRRILWVAAAVLCCGLVVMSRSTTALLGTGIVLGGLAGLSLLRRGGAVSVATVWLAVALGAAFLAMVTISPDLFFQLIGKDPTLTGRTDIWASLLRRVAERPWLGYGFGAFWLDPWGPAWFIRQEVQWTAPNAHNGWLDVLVQLGAVGLGLVALHFVAMFSTALLRLRQGPESYWTVLFLALFALFSISESTVMQYNGLSWVIYTATTAKLFTWRGFAGGPTPPVGGVKLFPD
jgi:O-antigen ligase